MIIIWQPEKAAATDAKKDAKKDLKKEKTEIKSALIAATTAVAEAEKKTSANASTHETEIKELEKIKKENINMVCYGLPDVILQQV